jgi:O-acetylhomoserine (thiol)-lyase
VENFEQRIRLLSDATGVVAVSSGMAAITNTILTLAEAGSNIVTTKYLFGNTYSLFEKTLKPWGLGVTYIDMEDMDALHSSINNKTRAVFLETITNPQLQVADISTIAEITKEHHVPLIIDGTLTTPYLFKSKDFGVDIEVLSSTKYISGGATTVGGVIIDNGSYDWSHSLKLQEWAKKTGPLAFVTKLKREIYRNLGSCLSPHNAYLQSLGLETLSLRIDRNCDITLKLAKFLLNQKQIKTVNYPGIEGSKYHQTAKRQFGNRFGGIITFELENQKQCFQFMDSLKLIRRATNLNDNKTLIIHPSSTIFCEYAPEEKKEMGVSDCMIRLAVGIEDVEDLIEDMNEGLEALE